MTKIAVIDLGSNSVRVSIAEKESGKVLHIGKSPIKLSEGMNKDMLLKDEAINRCIAAFSELREALLKFGVSEVYAFSTAAVRKAKNKDEFLSLMKEETGIKISVLSGQEEAELDFWGVIEKTKVQDALILDTGGGSTEFIGVRNGEIIGAVSIPLGSRSIKELFFTDGETLESIHKAKEEIEKIVDGIEWLESLSGFSVIGIGGSNRTVGRIYLEAGETDSPIDNLIIDKSDALSIMEKIESSTIEERFNIKGITQDRCDIILGGILPLKTVMKRLNCPKLYITDAGLRDGIIKKIRENPKEMEKYATVLSL